ncbi:RES family NAD+ phosphorylase [Pseudomonas sichuanensis]|uniref:RES family NAD+ phosphorylase n=1 Tax=Pseudomonas sichuanensis TaxID=2213015 RepID=UPI0036E417F6
MALLDNIWQEILAEEDAEEPMFVCVACIGDTWLKQRASRRSQAQLCACCGASVGEALTSKKIAETIKKHLPDHFAIDYGLHPGYEMGLSRIIGLAIRCESKAVCNAVAARLVDLDADEEDFYFDGQEYCWASSPFESEEHERWWVEGDWTRIATELVHGRRFFNTNANTFFESLIVEAMRANSPENAGVASVVKIVPQGTRFYRARIASTQGQLLMFQDDPAKQLGAPPKDRAANNRMSPSGVPLLYVAEDAQTGIAEVRPSIGDKVVVAEFVSARPLEFFDFKALTALKHQAISWFEPGYQVRTDRRRLLEYLHDLIAQPVRANDTDYVVTQALAEFIRYYGKQRFDGISFRSVQREGGVNYVIFDRSPLESLQIPDWVPQFDLVASKDAVSVFEIARVEFHATKLGS